MTGPLWAWELAASCRFEAQGLPFNPFCLLSALLQGRVNFRFSGRDVAVFLHPIFVFVFRKAFSIYGHAHGKAFHEKRTKVVQQDEVRTRYGSYKNKAVK